MYQEQRPQSKLFGFARDYYRVRLIRVDEELPDDLEWRNDILYTSPKAYPSKLKITYRLQVLTLDNNLHEPAILQSKKAAKKRLRRIEGDLQELTKMQFDDKYGIEGTGVNVNPMEELLSENTIYFTGINNS